MSLLKELGLTEDEFRNVSQPVREKILAGMAKVQAFSLISSQEILNRSSKRLDQQSRAIRNSQGIKMPDSDDPETVLGDKVTHTHNNLLSPAAAAVLTAAIVAAGAIGWKMVDSHQADSQPPSGYVGEVTPGFGEPVYVEPTQPD